MNELTGPTAVAMIRATVSRIDNSARELSRLDAVAGDGDHGVNMAAGFRNAEARLATEQPAIAADVFAAVGQTFGESAGGSAGALFGALFGALGGRLGRSPAPEARDLVDGLELATKRVALIGQVKVGAKTMLDALEPATRAAREALDAGGGLADVVSAAAVASRHGAAATADMRAVAGRARHAPNGAVGTRDPGAVTISIMFTAWAETIALEVGS